MVRRYVSQTRYQFRRRRAGGRSVGRPLTSKYRQFRNSATRTVRRLKAKIRHAALTRAPMWLSRGRLADGKAMSDISCIERDIALPDLPDQLDGLRITHLTDLHIGSIITPARLPGIVEATNAMGGDLIAVTGDYLDLSIKVLDDVIDAMQQLTAPLGVFFVAGNHDYLDDHEALPPRFREAGLRILMNETEVVERRGKRIVISGVDFPHKAKDMRRYVLRALKGAPRRRDDDLRVLLSHHPNAFDIARQRRVDLTLAGHTHGGQLVLSNTRGKKGSIGLGSLAHRYPRGLYRRGDSYLYVNSGVGSWFPLRVNCPAEIACLTMRCSPEPGEVGGERVSHP